jgi:Recombinase zinc beta ribbon domain
LTGLPGKGGRYRYYTCSTKARQGETGCAGRTVPMEKLDTLVANYIEHRLLQPKRLDPWRRHHPPRSKIARQAVTAKWSTSAAVR